MLSPFWSANIYLLTIPHFSEKKGDVLSTMLRQLNIITYFTLNSPAS
jgi:hypothetical protein